MSALLSHQPLPRGRRVAVVTNAGGPGILAADACEGHGLELATLSEASRGKFRSFLPPSANVSNPIDMLASAPPEHYGRTLDIVLRDPAVDSVIAIFIPSLVTAPEPVAAEIRDAAAGSTAKPVLAVMMRAEGAPESLASLPSYAFPESAAIALARATSYAEWRRKPLGMVPDGVEMLVGAVNDPLFGPVVVCGSGGVLAELLADSATRLHPVSGTDAAEMIDELRGARLMRGFRGQAAVDESALKDAILRASALLSLCPEIATAVASVFTSACAIMLLI